MKDGELRTTQVKGKTGTAVYDEKLNTLTLNNFTTMPDNRQELRFSFCRI